MKGERDNGDDQRRWFTSLRGWLTCFRHPIGELDVLVSALAVLVGLAGILVLGWIVLAFISALGDPTGSFEAARNLALILAAVIGLPFLIWRSWIGERQARAALHQAATAEENVVTSSFTRAIEQLGATRNAKEANGHELTIPNLEVRFGALYALERLHNSSEKDRAAVAEIIVAYVQENGQRTPDPDDAPQIHESTDPRRFWDEFGERIRKRSPPKSDVQAALSILLRSCTSRVGMPRRSVEWWQLDATRADFRSAMRPNLDLRGAGMVGARLADADMRGCDLRGASLSGATMWNADLRGAKMNSTNLDAALLPDAKLQRVSLVNAQLRGADLSRSNLDDAHLNATRMDCATLRGTILDRADLSWATLFKADVSRANLSDAIAWGVDFSDVRGLTQEQIDSLWEGDAATTLPDEIDGQPVKRPRHWLAREINGREILERIKLHRAGKPPPGLKS